MSGSIKTYKEMEDGDHLQGIVDAVILLGVKRITIECKVLEAINPNLRIKAEWDDNIDPDKVTLTIIED